MHYLVNFLHMKKGHVSVAGPPNIAHFETNGGGMIPNIGDVVHIGLSSVPGRSSYQGTVTDRLFRYVNAGNCEVSVILDDHFGGGNSE